MGGDYVPAYCRITIDQALDVENSNIAYATDCERLFVSTLCNEIERTSLPLAEDLSHQILVDGNATGSSTGGFAIKTCRDFGTHLRWYANHLCAQLRQSGDESIKSLVVQGPARIIEQSGDGCKRVRFLLLLSRASSSSQNVLGIL